MRRDEASRRNRPIAAVRATSGDNSMGDRFDRRELLLHLGDMLQALSCSARTGAPATPVAQLAREEHLFRDFEFLRALPPSMTVADFGARVASAFFLWPKELLDAELNRRALASTIQHDLFDRNPDGWSAYVAHIKKKATCPGLFARCSFLEI
jgi:hypothetical protein